MKMVKILLDGFGGDHSPEANVDGGLQALKAMPDLELILTGDEEALKKDGYMKGGIEFDLLLEKVRELVMNEIKVQ